MAPELLERVLHQDQSSTTTPITRLAHLTILPALLRDHCRRKVAGADYPGITAEKGMSVRGTFVSGLDDDDMRMLDTFEGDGYARRWVTVEILDGQHSGQEMAAETYIFLVESGLEESEWDFRWFCREKLAGWVGLSSQEEFFGELKQPLDLARPDMLQRPILLVKTAMILRVRSE